MLNKRILVLVFVVAFLTLVTGCLPPITENQAPIITSDPVETAKVGVAYTYDVDATDPDEDILTYSLTVKPTNMTINSTTGVINWTPSFGQVGDNAVTVVVSDGDLSVTQSFTIKVSKPTPTPTPVKLTKIVVKPDEMTLFVGDEETIESVTAHYSNGSTFNIPLGSCTYTSSAIGVATVDTGIVSALTPGTATITVSYKGKTDTVAVTVSAVELDHIVALPEKMTLPLAPTLHPVATRTISVTAYYNDESTKDIDFADCTYDLSPEGIITVNKQGVVFPKAYGKTTITVSYTEGDITKTDTVEVTVIGPVHNIDKDTYFDTIQEAISDEGNHGDTIEVAPGTYNENVVIDRSLTIKSVEGPEATIIDALGVEIAVLINGTDTVATFDGFTVKNYETIGILAGAKAEKWGDDPYKVHILNNIVEEPGPYDVHNNCIQVGDGTTGTIIGNEVFGATLEDPDWSGSGILVFSSSNVLISNNYVHDCEGGIQIQGWPSAPAENNVIEYNLVEDNESGIVPQMNSIGTIIRYNDVLNNDEGIAVMAWIGLTPSGTQVRYNNIVGNEDYGVKSGSWDASSVEVVDATLNWWGDLNGPSYDSVIFGDKISDNVNYIPWSTNPY